MISDFDKIEFHDLPVKSVGIDFIDKAVNIVVKKHDNAKQDYLEIILVFKDVSFFYWQRVEYIEMSEIFDCNLREENGAFFIEFTMLTESPAIPCVMSFYFKEVDVITKDDADW